MRNKTLIVPNKLCFDVEINDLPIRAIQVSKDALDLSGGRNCNWATNKGIGVSSDATIRNLWAIANKFCPSFCKSRAKKFNPDRRYRTRRRNGYLQCSCCD